MSGCWLCGSAESYEVMPSTVSGEVKSEDFKISDSHYGRTARIVECRSCGFRYADPIPAPDLTGMYESLADSEYDEGSEGRIGPFRKILTRCLSLKPGIKDALDIGASTGLLCMAARELGINAVGVEPSGWAVDIAKGRHGVDVLQGIFPHPALEGRGFDLITLVDVIEHVPDPVGLLKDAGKALRPGGFIVVVTPNVRSIAARLMGRRWWHYRLAHICYFDRRTMGKALGLAGLKVRLVEDYVWSFTIGYVAERLGRYLPVGGLVRLVARTGIGRWFFDIKVPVNLKDSDIYYAERT